MALEIGDVARQAELSIDAVRFYEREGLLGRVRQRDELARPLDGEPDDCCGASA